MHSIEYYKTNRKKAFSKKGAGTKKESLTYAGI